MEGENRRPVYGFWGRLAGIGSPGNRGLRPLLAAVGIGEMSAPEFAGRCSVARFLRAALILGCATKPAIRRPAMWLA